MKQALCILGLGLVLSGCNTEDINNAVVNSSGKDFETVTEKLVYAQYVADNTAAIVDAVLENNCITDGECFLNGHSYTVDSRDYTLDTTTNVTIVKNNDTLIVTAKNTNPDQQIFLKDTNSNNYRISTNLLDSTYYVEIDNAASPYSISFYYLVTDSQDLYGDQGLTFKVKSTTAFSYDSNSKLLTGGSAMATYKDSNSYNWSVDTDGTASIN